MNGCRTCGKRCKKHSTTCSACRRERPGAIQAHASACDCPFCRTAAKRKYPISARLTDREYAALERIAKMFDGSASDALRYAIMAADGQTCTQARAIMAADAQTCMQVRAVEGPSDQLAFVETVCGEEY